MKNKLDYDKEHDIFSVNWGGEVEHSVELFDGNLILDIDKDDEIVGMEIFGINKELDKIFGFTEENDEK